MWNANQVKEITMPMKISNLLFILAIWERNIVKVIFYLFGF